MKVRPNHGLAASQVYADFGGLATDTRVRLLNDPIPARRYVWRRDTARMVGVTEMPKSRVKRIVRESTAVYLPIFHDGAYFYFGDGHARQGHGEVAGTGLETSMDVVLRLDAYALVGQVGESTVANIVDPAYSVVAKIRKRYLGPRSR